MLVSGWTSLWQVLQWNDDIGWFPLEPGFCFLSLWPLPLAIYPPSDRARSDRHWIDEDVSIAKLFHPLLHLHFVILLTLLDRHGNLPDFICSLRSWTFCLSLLFSDSILCLSFCPPQWDLVHLSKDSDYCPCMYLVPPECNAADDVI